MLGGLESPQRGRVDGTGLVGSYGEGRTGLRCVRAVKMKQEEGG
jgi:hypothetical protein